MKVTVCEKAREKVEKGVCYPEENAFPFSFNVYLFLRERHSQRETVSLKERDRGAERERESQNPKQAPGSELSAQSQMQGSNSQAVRS